MFSTITAAPAKQSVSETISILSGRLTSATLLEDRRAAILGLRSFAKQYPASVSSGALRSLIGSLSKDGEDIDTVKVTLETLLMLFNPYEDSPEASEEIALWLADEFTQRQENISLLLDFLETNDFYSRLYSLQLLSAILSARTARTEECILTAPLGIPRLVSILDDQRDAIRNEAIGLLTDLTPASVDIQKLVAFESVFERVFRIIKEDGGLLEGGRTIEDCLILLANLLRLNSSNQSMFREMGFIAHLGRLLASSYLVEKDGEEVAPWAQAQRNRNIYALLAVIRLFLVSGAVGTQQNQDAFLKDQVLQNALQLAFSRTSELPIKSEALVTCADMIRGNSRLQESFAGLQVPSPLDEPLGTNGAQPNGVPKVFVIDGLLDLTLVILSPQAFDMRMAACRCLKAYFYNHSAIRLHFLRRAIEGHKSGADELTNIFAILLQPTSEAAASDPYRYWFASVLMMHLIHDNPTTKGLAMGVTEGDAASGEELVTSIQTITAHFLGCVAKSADTRILTGYLMLLLCWLFEDLDGVNDFLGEGSNVQGLIQAAVENPNGDTIVQGLSAMLVGVLYEFSTKDSPIPRATLRDIIMSRMGRDRYIDKLSRLRAFPLMRDHEVLSQNLDLAPDQKLPDAFFDDTFVDFFKDNYSRILRAIDRDPGMEISVVTNGIQKGISRELVDSLRAQVAEKERVVQDLEVEKTSLARQLGQEQADHRRTKESSSLDAGRTNETVNLLKSQLDAKSKLIQDAEAAKVTMVRSLTQEQSDHRRTKESLNMEISRLKKASESLQRSHQEEINLMRSERRIKEEELQKQLESARKTADQEMERLRRRSEAEKADFKATISRLEVDLMKANKAKTGAASKITELEGKLKSATDQVTGLEKQLQESRDEVKNERQKSELLLKEKDEEKSATQGELDDLLMVFTDLEEKAERYKVSTSCSGFSSKKIALPTLFLPGTYQWIHTWKHKPVYSITLILTFLSGTPCGAW